MNATWRKSSYSGGVDDDLCVELAPFPSAVAVRDSKNPHLGHLTLSPRHFTHLLTGIKHHDAQP
ncbi:uncharacterized protein DUF397 [Actinocorallia herbida]|uniref:Uncharacterized protein DUF397 n=1 Tax=Actinocorallia herbida TaxID=58109 RepID=A0A3N1D0U7_9ACTN|nr:DUF397 domain-containing protein [Actinocorallia herbida]ROO87126.1 uncharacterized protein DUF397 [Actinocorallia herbida]